MNKRSLSLFMLLFVSATIAELASFSGRSGNVVYTPNNIQDDSFLFLMDKYSSDSNEEISETNVADLISYLVGTPILNPQASRESFPQGNIFEKDRANIMFVVDGVGSETIQSIPQLKTLKQSGQKLSIVKRYYPQDNVASLTTIFTGYGPSAHGVVNKTWTSPQGKSVAYSNLQSSPQTANLADVVSQSFAGKSLIVSASSDSQLTSIFGVNQFANKHLSTNSFGYYWNEKTNSFKNIYSSAINIPSTKQNLLEAIAARVYQLRNKGDRVKYSNDQIAVDFPTENIHVVFDLAVKEDFLLFAELELVHSIVASLQSPAMKVLVDDSVPDLFTFAFSAIKGLQARYGKDSTQVTAALLILDGTLSKAVSDFKILYGRVAVEIAFVGVPAYTKVQESASAQTKADVYSVIKTQIKNKDLFNAAFPVIYADNVETACQTLKTQGFSTLDNLDLTCPTKRLSLSGKNLKETRSISDSQNYPDYASFNIILWTSIILILAVYGAVYPIFSMSGGNDSFLRAPVTK